MTSLEHVTDLLEAKRLHYFVRTDRVGVQTVYVTDVGKRIEVYLDEDGNVDFSVFRGNEDVCIGLDALKAELAAD